MAKRIADLARYGSVWWIFCRNSLIRDLSFRTDFVLQAITSLAWALMNFALFKIIYQHTDSIGRGTGWHEHEFFVFLGTIWIVNGIVQTLFMSNFDDFSDMIRLGNLDYALVKPIDTQFLISFPRLNWSQLPNVLLGLVLVIHSSWQLAGGDAKSYVMTPWTVVMYLFFIGCGVVVMYGAMLCLAATSIWLGRNQNLYDFWFYITNFYRYPMEIYQRNGIGWALWGTFTFVVPILVVSNVPARVMAQPLGSPWQVWEWCFAALAVLAAIMSLIVSRFVFRAALASYRSASS